MDTQTNLKTGQTDEPGKQLMDLVEFAQALIAATAHVPEEKVVEARQRLLTAIQCARKHWRKLQEQAAASAKATDQIIRGNPYQALGMALGVGAIIGYLLRRRE